MKTIRLENFYRIFDKYKPQRICEIGTHNGRSAAQLSSYLLEMGLDVEYTGYDMFDAANTLEFHKAEHNGKGAGSFETATERLAEVQKKFPNFKFTLIQGNTHDTFTIPCKFDFAFIDGGHSYETVKHDYEMLKETPVIVFDDYQINEIYQFVNEIGNFTELPRIGPKLRQALKIHT
jgi:predicted O-methyltransferase YrrM